MNTGSNDERQQPPEPTFTDMMHGFGLDDVGREQRQPRWGWRRGENPAPTEVPPAPAPLPQPVPLDAYQASYPLEEITAGASAVRPYAWTRGRTKSGFDLAIETLVSTSPMGRGQLGMLQVEHRSVAELCMEPRSVAEVAALLSLPLGVARVLLGDMAGLGVVIVHQTASSAGSAPDLALMERVLSGLRRL
ncbi:DUF742 domain-containing protein [Pseudonocardia hispaniensis]|uniref:DUF742 domain-containing protein n=1 Tax=Pseudonocardia hispaniensis TaxID=904933 RepID=A0ABW1J507_9PSEU